MMVYHVLHVRLNLLFSKGKPRNVFLRVLRQETGFSRKNNSLREGVKKKLIFFRKNPKLWVGGGQEQRVAYRFGKLSNAEISDFSASRRVSRVEPPISSTFDKLGEGSAGEGTLARW